MPFRDASFDRVICAEVMEHVHDYGGAARELARVLRSGGRLAVTIPTATSERLYLRLGDDYFESPGGHIRIFRPRQLAEALGAAGLRTEGAGFAHPPSSADAADFLAHGAGRVLQAGSRCGNAPFIFPTTGMVSVLWNDSFRLGTGNRASIYSAGTT